MAIVTMKRLRLLAMREDREALLDDLQRLGCVEVSEPTLDGREESGAAELLSRLTPPDTQALSQAQTRRQEAERAMLRRAVDRLSPREKKIMVLRFGLGASKEHTQKEVADQLGISQSYISRLEKRIIHRLRRDLEKAG